MFRRITISILISLLLWSCQQRNFSSPESLVRYYVGLINSGDRGKFRKSLMTKTEYVNEVFPETVDSKGGLTGTEFWEQFIALQRINAMEKYFQIFDGCRLEVLSVQPAKEILSEGRFRFHKRIRVNLASLCRGKPKEYLEDQALFGIVIEKPNGTFSLMNVARD